MSDTAGSASGSTARLVALAVLALWIMAPVTLPVPVLRALVQERFAVSELLTSLFMSVNMLGALLTAPLVGAVVDRLGRRRALLAGSLLVDALCFAALTLPIPFPLFMALRFVEGCAHIAALSILLTLASHALGAERRGLAMGVVGGSMMLGVAMGAPLGGLLGRGGPLVPLQVGALLLAVASLVAALWVRDVQGRDERPGLREIVAALRAHPEIIAPLAYAFADRFTVGFFTTTFSLYLGRIYGTEPAEIGMLIALFMLPFALLSYPFGWLADRGSPVLLLCGGSILYGVATSFVGFADPAALRLLMPAIGVTAAVMFVPSMLLTTQIAPDSIRATALGAFNAAGSLGFVVGPAVGGAVSQAVAAQSGWPAGYRAAFGVAGASEILCVVLTLPILLRIVRRPRG